MGLEKPKKKKKKIKQQKRIENPLHLISKNGGPHKNNQWLDSVYYFQKICKSDEEFASRWMSMDRKSVWTVCTLLMTAAYIVFL